MSEPSVIQTLNTVQLKDVAVTRILANNRQDEMPLPPDEEVRWNLKTTVSYRQPVPNGLDIKVHGTLEYQIDSPQPFDLTVEIVGRYQSEQPIPAEQVPLIVQTHSVPLLWPYLRELISNLTMRMGGPTIMVPTLNITVQMETAPKPRRRKAKTENAATVAPSEDGITTPANSTEGGND